MSHSNQEVFALVDVHCLVQLGCVRIVNGGGLHGVMFHHKVSGGQVLI